MSDTDDIDTDNSFLTNLTNKVIYKAHKIAYDPNANKFAKKEDSKKEIKTKPSESNFKRVKNFFGITDETEKDKGDLKDKTPVEQGDPNKFNFKRFIKKTGVQFTTSITTGIIPFLALMFSMLVANSCIIYSVPIRVIMFIFTFLLCLFIPFYTIILFAYYAFMGLYSYYMNNLKSNGIKKDYLPTIFSLLPISTYQAESSFIRFFIYPFVYPKSEIAKIKLDSIMKEYISELQNNFTHFDKYSVIPDYKKQIDVISDNLMNLHNK
jgi:hypothetical protein